ncbi:Uu.00g100940.m01.CDS01 [Anthostomella pinea]|uniref:alpha-1,2-Mannosidase n=1 Tax=Anthostomella pinea TaxID=933095 RepID=A0AAI8VD46_9PEZI|nr:Uu.00g100940.m01.CDS01 [Anthostomella pinea]
MATLPRRKLRLIALQLVAALFICYVLYARHGDLPKAPLLESARLASFMNTDPPKVTPVKSSFDWSHVKLEHLPLTKSSSKLHDSPKVTFPRIQHRFETESPAAAEQRLSRREAVRRVFQRDWEHYRQHAWLKDAVNPISGSSKDQFAGWAAMLVDSLDALWIMGLRTEFDEAVAAVAGIDFGHASSSRVNMFETTIRYLGGLLAAYDLSGRDVLLTKAVELGDLLYAGFNTPNQMPVDFIDFERAKSGKGLTVESWVVSASPGSLSMEMTRLSQVTGDMKYFDAVMGVMRVFEEQQSRTRLPGLWPIWVSMRDKDVSARSEFTLGGSADSLFEYLPKMYALTGGWEPMYGTMSKSFMEAANKHMIFRPMLPDEQDILMSGNVKVDSNGASSFDPETEHLTCFIGGTMALGGRLFNQPHDVETGTKLAKGCGYAYRAFTTGIMPERIDMLPCDPPRASVCKWDEDVWIQERQKRPEYKEHLPKGFTTAKDPRYLLRPEAIESIFVSYRITGDPELLEMAWDMFRAVDKGSEAQYGHASIKDVTQAVDDLPKEDYMESFWLAETLKYFYLIFSSPDLISLDEWVLNTEAHPFRIPADQAPEHHQRRHAHPDPNTDPQLPRIVLIPACFRCLFLQVSPDDVLLPGELLRRVAHGCDRGVRPALLLCLFGFWLRDADDVQDVARGAAAGFASA